jgi:hypothetical protein
MSKIYKISKDLEFNNKDPKQTRKLSDSVEGVMVLKSISVNNRFATLEFIKENGKNVGLIYGLFTKNESYDYYELTDDGKWNKLGSSVEKEDE